MTQRRRILHSACRMSLHTSVFFHEILKFVFELFKSPEKHIYRQVGHSGLDTLHLPPCNVRHE